MAIPSNLLQDLLKDNYYKTCIRAHEKTCKGRITFEHALIYAGRQVQEKFAIVPLCAFHHAVNEYQDCGDLKKDYNQYIALTRATYEELQKYKKADWIQRRRYLASKYGKRDADSKSDS